MRRDGAPLKDRPKKEWFKFLAVAIALLFMGLFGYQLITGRPVVAVFTLIAVMIVIISLTLVFIYKQAPTSPNPEVRKSFWIFLIIAVIAFLALLIFFEQFSEILNVQFAVQQLQSMINVP